MPLLGSIMTISDAGSPTTTAKSVIEENMTWSRSADRPETNEIRGEIRQESKRRHRGRGNLRGLSSSTSPRIQAAQESVGRVEGGKVDVVRGELRTAGSVTNDFERVVLEEAGRWDRGSRNDRRRKKRISDAGREPEEDGGRGNIGDGVVESATKVESAGNRKNRSSVDGTEEVVTEKLGAQDRVNVTAKERIVGSLVQEDARGSTELYEKSTLSTLEEFTRPNVSSRNPKSTQATIRKVASPSGQLGAASDCECSKSNEHESQAVDTETTDSFGVVEDLEDQLLFRFENTMEDLCDSFNDSFNETVPFPWNNSLYNETFIVMGEGMYPSGYTLPHIILASIVATLLMIVIVVGNMLVIIAIATEKALKNIQNWFIASLAVADFFLGLVIMPFSLANEIMGYWIFGYWWCDIYSAMDVLLCTASIMNLCLISLDRFWSITQAVAYLKKRTPARAALMIGLVWILSALVCIPPLLGWKRPTPEEEYPKCKLSEDIGYVLYSALGSFYIPSCIMVFVYIRIYFAAKARARRGIRKQPRPRPAVPPESPDVRQTSFTQSTPATDTRRAPGSVMENVATIESQPVQIPIVTCDFASDVSTSEADPGGGSSIPLEEKDTLKVSIPIIVQKTNLKASLSVNGDGQSTQSSSPRCRAPSVGIDVDMVSEFDPSSSDSGVVSRCAVVKPLKLRLCQPIFGRKNVAKLKREHGDVSRGHASKEDASMEAKCTKPRDPEREKRRLARKKEKRATLILGFIMGSFIACWLPFFVLYIVKPLFPYVEIPSQAFVIAFWLGYMNSAFNPFIYTVFNKDFRRAFRRILFK